MKQNQINTSESAPKRIVCLTSNLAEDWPSLRAWCKKHPALSVLLWSLVKVDGDLARSVRSELDGGELKCGDWAVDSLCAEPALVSTLREGLHAAAPDCVLVPSADDSRGRAALQDRNALCWAGLSALSLGPARVVHMVRPGGRFNGVRNRPLDSRRALTKWRKRMQPDGGTPSVTAVVSTWNKAEDVCANLEALQAQVEPFDDIVVVDNQSSDDTAVRLRDRFPHVRLVIMPNSDYGACETFNIGFSCALTDCTAILDDDVVLPPDWLALSKARMQEEPASTAVVSTKIVEPGMPEAYKNSDEINTERYMSTFRGCASLARTKALTEAGGYDERLFIYGNERDLTCRFLNLGYRVLQYPKAIAYHKTPFGIKMGKRSLYFHARNAWLSMLKYAPAGDLARMPIQVVRKVLMRSGSQETSGEISDATGTIGIGRSLRETPGAWWVVTKAALSVAANIPYCLKHRKAVKSPDFELPLD
ncbi:MAG: glycosyltransferase family 2 protein [bacterium]|nr:glycosyltransferase family 2 protein [bacterium]